MIDNQPAGVWWMQDRHAVHGPTHPALTGDLKVDVCIVGGGFTGLWTAIELKELQPERSVALIERTHCGAGGSGRNGGWATGWHDELDVLTERFGTDEGLRLAARSAWAIERVRSFSEQHGIDCQFRQRGALWVAGAQSQVGAWDDAVRACIEHRRVDKLEVLAEPDLAKRTGTPRALAAARQTDAATVQPARLVAGLRTVADDLGVQVFESTPMIRLVRGREPVVITPSGRIRAGRVVLAIGAWSSELRELRRAIVPVASTVIATEPLGERLTLFPWSDGEALGDGRLMVHYAQITPDGRMIFGRGGGALGRAGRVRADHFRDPRTIAEVIADFRHWFPALADVAITHAWAGPVDRAPGHLPFTGALDQHGRILYGTGFSGNGVAPSALIGRILGRQTLDIDDEDTNSPLTAGPPNLLPPEPFLTVGGFGVSNAVRLTEHREQNGASPSRLMRYLRPLAAATVPPALDPQLKLLRRHAR